MNLSEQLIGLLERVARVAAAAAILVACAVMVHQHTHQADRAPYVAVDDALANISASMVALGRNGFPASPLQAAAGKADPRRHEVQLNYGYAPFLLGAALDWTFGTSYVSLRGIHVAGLILAIGICWLAFRSETVLAPLLFTGIVATVLWPTHWPMFRPDIGTALSAIIAVAFAMAALRSNGLFAWLGTGFFAATAFGSHQIAWAMVPWAALIWLIAVALTEPGRRLSDVTIGPFIAVAVGGILGLIAYAWGIGWRISDIAAIWTGYSDFLSDRTGLSYFAVLRKHLNAAGGLLGPGRTAAAIVIMLSALAIATLCIWRRHRLARPVAAVAVPGAAAAIIYLLGLGFYPNWHSGYVLLPQLASAWAAAGGVAMLVVLVRSRIGERARPALAATAIAGALVLVGQSSRLATNGTIWADAAANFVSFTEYESRIFAEVPRHASVAGSIIFGLKSGTRHHLIQMGEATALLERLGPQSQRRLLVDHFVLNSETVDIVRWLMNQTGTMGERQLKAGTGLLGDGSPFNKADITYGETSITFAEPYGETRVLTRDGLSRPAVSLYDRNAQTWSSRFAPAEAIRVAAAPVTLAVKGAATRLEAEAGLKLHVEPGTYLVEVDIATREGGSAIVAGAMEALIEIDLGRVNPFGTASVGIAFAGNKSLHVIMRAPSGVGYIGYFGRRLSGPLTVKRIERLLVDPERATPLPLPPLADWAVQSQGAKLKLSDDGRTVSVAGVGIPVGYQLMSPAITVAPDTEVTVRFDLKSTAGKLGLGFLDEKGFWVDGPVPDGKLTINTRANKVVRLLLINLGNKALPEPARFELRIDGATARETYGPKRLYVDLLARCFGPSGKTEASAACR